LEYRVDFEFCLSNSGSDKTETPANENIYDGAMMISVPIEVLSYEQYSIYTEPRSDQDAKNCVRQSILLCLQSNIEVEPI
jgi:hypothetical protein